MQVRNGATTFEIFVCLFSGWVDKWKIRGDKRCEDEILCM